MDMFIRQDASFADVAIGDIVFVCSFYIELEKTAELSSVESLILERCGWAAIMKH